MTEPVSLAVARWVDGLDYEDIPGHVVEHLKLCLLDAFGCGIYGATQSWGQIVAKTAVEHTGFGQAALFAGGGCGSPAEAALANGTAVHGFELDDTHVSSSLHAGAVVVPAVLAVLTGRAISGRDLIAALAAGYETGIRVGICAGVRHSTSGFHVTGTVGTVAAGMAAAKALKLSADETLHALGIAATQASGLYSARKNAMTKRLHAGLAARAGVTGALLAKSGFTGSTEVLEADFGGFFSTLAGEHPSASVLQGLGETWETARVGFKAYASCASSHTTVDALEILMSRGLTADNLEHLELALSGKGAINVGWPYAPGTVISAQMNAQYVAAAKLLEGDVFIRQFREDLLDDPRVMDLVRRVSIRHDPAIDALGAALRHTVMATAWLRDGRTLAAEVNQRKGSADHPLSPGEIRDKFRKLVTCAPFIDAAATEEAVNCLDVAHDVSRVLTAPLLAAPDQPR